MFCVIQELTTKRENPLGFPKRLEVMQESVPAEDGTERIKWGYTYSDECFERPVKKSYKVLPQLFRATHSETVPFFLALKFKGS